MSPIPKKTASSAVKSKRSSGKNTGYEIKDRKLKKFEYKERITPARLAFERYKIAQKELNEHQQGALTYKCFGELTYRYQSSLPWHLAFRSGSPMSLLLFYCQRNMLNVPTKTNTQLKSSLHNLYTVMVTVVPVSLILFCCQRHLTFWRK